MLRITLGGAGLGGFPKEQDGAYIKLRMREPVTSEDSPLLRTYTVRRYDASTNEMDVDFVVHNASGPAVDWARSCSIGDQIKVGGPGPKSIVDYAADWFLLVGDMSALPAISANIEGMPQGSKGHVILEVISEDDRQELGEPEGLKVNWIVNPSPERKNTLLLDAVRRLQWPDGRPSVWVAGEFSQSLAIRAFLRKARGIPREQMYASSYWQIGQTEDGHRISRRGAADD